MNRFKALEKSEVGFRTPLDEMMRHIKFNDQGLIPAVAQQFDTKEVLMMAWMNRDALQETLDTGRVCYWSRSRGGLWRKGESSGQIQLLKTLALDCDGDTVLMQVDQKGPACHTGRRSCFFYQVDGSEITVNADVLISPDELYKK
ncbi:phosphoribosyl-AMP cyclohydrolase [Ketobacter alkanivorans]|uniref:Phosphoribosyl-AMP cyclohydrolase n=1 Tax=Ketobacter alkanivorans TaxID=1917421 RepID=A0A2K9LFU1_9GAMM|nr:phosphoribosyl-AMP cyclohydrolase [Ketobacter alkanivorans]AUM11142.1 phosphoribosyl-AMP cyclohydrolase [Ketobacter alkanivorans]MCP5017352.1 phosphoribosyl-AMP cyclohydrolase [Ketobacter sp.]